MRQKLIINFLIVLVASGLLLILWFNGLDWIYAQLLKFGANLVLLVSNDTSVGLQLVDGSPTFVVDTVMNGRQGSYPQKADLILLPFIMIITWQILLLFNIAWKKALRSSLENIILFYIIQLIFVLLLTGYHTSSTVKFIYDLLLDSFYIIALFIIVKDTFKYNLLESRRQKQSDSNKNSYN
jgi:hypothetical protein